MTERRGDILAALDLKSQILQRKVQVVSNWGIVVDEEDGFVGGGHPYICHQSLLKANK